MDIAAVLDKLVPQGLWQGSVTVNTREAYEAVRWADERKKPTWKELETVWPEVEAEIRAAAEEPDPITKLAARLDAAEEEIRKLKEARSAAD